MSEQPEKPPFKGLPKPEKSADDGAAASGAAETPKDEKKEEKKEVKKEEKKDDKKREKVDLSKAKIGFIGAGKMADAIIRGLIQFRKADPKRIYVAAKSTKNLENMKRKGCHKITKSNYEIFARYDCDFK